MLFNSISFLIFLPTVFILYWLLPGKLRTPLLLIASCYFYMAFVPQYILILLYLITLDFFLARLIEKAEGKKRTTLFLISIASNLLTLGFFKYFNFFNDNVANLAQLLHWNYSLEALSIILPLGLSFHIFQSLAYIIEVYKRRFPAERNYLTYSLYVMFFPQLVAGPIERPAQLLPQLNVVHRFSESQATAGLVLMLRGFFKKVVIGNNLAVLTDFVFAHSATADASVLLVGAVAFAFLLYADFSGYSDIAVGSAKLFGINLLENFRQPYFSRSTSELWRRWHISLSSWFRDYLYIPLGGSRAGLTRTLRNTLIVFAVMGLWHGAGWSFVVMGLLFGTYICIGLLTRPWRAKAVEAMRIPGWVLAISQTAITFGLTTIAWIFFRAHSLEQALTYVWRLFTEWSGSAFAFLFCSDYCSFYALGIGRKTFIIAAASVVALLIYEYIVEMKVRLPAWCYSRAARWSLLYTCIIWILLAGLFVPKTFIYFQF